MTMETNEITESILGGLQAMIDAAPAESPITAIQTPHRPSCVRESSGWGSRYVSEIELVGEEWLSALKTARPIARTGGLLVFVGDRGPGKTQMAAEIARSGDWPEDRASFTRADNLIVHRGRTAIYKRAVDIFLDLRHAAKNHVKSSEKDVLARLADCGLLTIDEFQERGETEWENRMIKNLIDKRYASRRPTIIIANMARRQVFESLGDSIIDRARENGKSIEFSWPSFRAPAPRE